MEPVAGQVGERVGAHFLASLAGAEERREPWRHWLLRDCLSDDVLDGVIALPFEAAALDGVSGARALHNERRVYFTGEVGARFPLCASVAAAFQSPAVVGRLQAVCGAALEGTFLRIEYAQDTDGFWLEPHTDIGAKRFSMLIYVSRDAAHRGLGTDIYDGGKAPVERMPFVPGHALMFVPGDDTFHGFERREIVGARKSLIVNYVGAEWRARHELAFPEAAVSAD